MKNTNILEVKNLTFGYDDDPVLKNFNMTIAKNEILLIDGENGVGKTTLLKCITNILNNGKNVFINGIEVYSNKKILKNISFVMSEDTLYDYLTLKENIVFFKTLFDEDDKYVNEVKSLCNELGIYKYEDYLIKNLSQGTRNKLYLSIMLSKNHNILILDEPFTALDGNTQSIMINKIKSNSKGKDKCVIMVTHVSEFKDISTRILTINKTIN
jgi:ABC-type multidrug transport system ATPase subunit